MFSESALDIIESRDGYRARLELDDAPMEPSDSDAMAPVIRVGGDYYGGGDAEAFNKQAQGFEDAFNAFGHIAGTNAQQREIFERYVRIFHGASKVQEWNVSASREYGYIAFDTAEWREAVGCTPEALQGEDLLQEVRDWATGEVYGVIVEKQLHYRKTYLEDPEASEDGTEWVEVEDGAVWGYVGREWAEQAAREALTEAINAEKD